VAERGSEVTVTVTAGDQTLEAGLEDLGVTVDAAATAQAAVDRDDSFTGVLSSTWAGEHEVAPVVSVDEEKAAEFAKGLVPEDRTDPVDAQVSLTRRSRPGPPSPAATARAWTRGRSWTP